jgi:hypothetical protein
MQIARTLAQKIAISLGVAGPLLSGIAVTTVSVATVPAASAVAPPGIAMSYNSTPKMSYN